MAAVQTESRQIQLPIDTINRLAKCAIDQYSYSRDIDYGWVIYSYDIPFMYLNDTFGIEAVLDITKCLNLARHSTPKVGR